MLAALSIAVTSAQAIVVSEREFLAPEQSLRSLERKSREASFLPVGLLTTGWQPDHTGRPRACTGTWLGEDHSYAYVLTAAHCLGDRHGPGAHAVTASFSDWQRRLIGRGRAWAFVPPEDGRPQETTRPGVPVRLAVVRLRRSATPQDPDGRPVPSPWIHDEGPLENDQRIQFVGHGQGSVGQPPRLGLTWQSRRLWGQGVLHGGEPNGAATLRFSFDPQGREQGFGMAEGDGGSAYWQMQPMRHRRERAAVIVGVHVGDDEPNSFLGVRVAPHARWLAEVFPGVRLASLDGRRVTAVQAFISPDHEAGEDEPMAYVLPPQAAALGTTIEPAHLDAEYSVLRTVVDDRWTGNRVPVQLRAHRMDACGEPLPMDDDAVCTAASGYSVLKVGFHPEDNPALGPSSFTGEMEVEVVQITQESRYERNVRFERELRSGKRSTQRRFKVPVSLDLMRKATLTASGPLEWPWSGGGGSYFTLPEQRGAARRGEFQVVQGGLTFLDITARDVLRQRDRRVTLRAHRDNGCMRIAMDDALQCGSTRQGTLRLFYDPADNPGLPAGLYRGQFVVRSHGLARRTDMLQVTLDLDTLPPP